MVTNVAITQDTTNTFSEADIRFNYANLQQVVCSSNSDSLSSMAVCYSKDGGGSWTQVSVSPVVGETFLSDPAVDWTSDGTAWLANIGVTVGATSNTLVVRSFTSPDGGKTWNFDSIVSGTQTFTDKPALWVDHAASSTFRDNLYVIWHLGGQAYLSRRAGLAGSWQTPQLLSGSETTGTADGCDVKTNTFGDVFAFWPSSGAQTLLMVKSTDGGVTWGALGSAPIQIATTFGSFTIKIPAQDARAVSGGTIGCLIYVSGGAYRTATEDNVYACWMDLTGESSCTGPSNAPGATITSTCKTRIWFASSGDGGKTWGSPAMIHNPSTLNDQFFPRLAVDETNGDLMIVYYDTVNDLTNRVSADLWMQSSTDGGASWATPIQITTASTNEAVGAEDSSQEYGDYIGLTGYAGQYFACWTDRRSGAAEAIWGAPIPLVQRACTFQLERDHYGQDEIDSIRTGGGSGTVKGGFWVAMDGFTPRELGVTGATSTAAAPPITFSPNTGVSASCSKVDSSDPTFARDGLQRIRFLYDVVFDASDSAFGFTGLTEAVTLTTSLQTLPASATVTFMKQPDPYLLQGAETWWLSNDVRLIQVAEGDTVFGTTMGTDPHAFLVSLTTNLEAAQGGPNNPFDQNTDEDLEVITTAPLTTRNGNLVPVFNFAVARVHYQAKTQSASHVRVFFRLFAANSTATNFEVSSTYSRSPATYPVATANYGNPVVATPGVQAGEYVSIPCYGVKRVSSTQAGAANSLPPLQFDSFNDKTLGVTGSGGHATFFGCFLDINQSAGVLPQTPPAGNANGPWPASSGVSVEPLSKAFVRNDHNCLVAEIAFDPDPVTNGTQPWNSDKLAQRNISWSTVAQ